VKCLGEKKENRSGLTRRKQDERAEQEKEGKEGERNKKKQAREAIT